MGEPTEVAPAVLDRLRACCLELPDAHEERAWVGIRWRVRTRTFAHVLSIADGWPPAYARAARTDGPATVLTFRSSGPELEVLGLAGPPFFRPPWRSDEVGMLIEDAADRAPADRAAIDWDEITELLTESYCVQAPRKLVELIGRPRR